MPRTAFVALCLLAFAACHREAKDPGLLVASGHVEATDVRVSTKIGGRLQTFGIQEGDVVQAGQELARIETIDLGLALQQARAERGQAAAQLALRVAGPSKEEIAQAAAQVAQARADLEGAQKDLARMQGLFDSGSGTTKSRDDAKTRRDMAAARVTGTREALARLKAGTRSEEIAGSRAQVAAVDARIAQLEQQMKDAVVQSPVGGVVTEKIAEQGELLQPGAGLAVITDLADAWLTVYVGGPDLGRVRLGQVADVVTDDGQSRQGKLTFIASHAEFTPRTCRRATSG